MAHMGYLCLLLLKARFVFYNLVTTSFQQVALGDRYEH